MEWILVKTLFSLAAVLALMVAVVYVLRKYVYQGAASGSTSTVPVEVLGQRALHPKRSVMVLKVMHTVLVVGMSEQGMQTLATIEDEESLAEIDAKLNAKVPDNRWMTLRSAEGGSSFAGQLQESIKAFLVRRGDGDHAGQESPASAGRAPAAASAPAAIPAPLPPAASAPRKPRRRA